MGKYGEFIKWLGTGLFLAAAILLSSNIEVSPFGFYLFLIGHIILSMLFWIINDKPMFVQNFFFVFVDLWGIYRWFIA